MNDHDAKNLQCWIPISLSKHTDEVNVWVSNTNSLDEERAHVGELEKLCLEMHDEVLGFSVVPHVIVLLSLVFIDADGMKAYHFAHYQENYTR